MTEFTLRTAGFGKWFHQNEGKYTGAFFEGVLLDNFVLDCKRGYAAFYEKPLNEWTSAYLVKFAPYADKDAVSELWNEFYDRYDEVSLAEWMNELGRSAA